MPRKPDDVRARDGIMTPINRRQFVKTSGGLIVLGEALSLVSTLGCSSDKTVEPPLGTDEPVYSSATDSLLAQDGFDDLTGITTGATSFTSRYPIYRTLGVDGGAVAIDSVVSLVGGRNGGNALRLTYGNPSGASDIIVGTETRLSSVGGWNGTLPEVAGPYTHFLFTTWVRFSVGADPASFDSSGVKGVMIWHTNNQRYQHAPHRLEDYQGGRYSQTRWDAGPPHPPNSVTGLQHWKTASGEAPVFANYTDGAWHRFTCDIYAGSGHNGERWWLDGTLMFDNLDNVGNLAWGADYTYTEPVTHWMVFGNYVSTAAAQGSPQFTVDFDDWIAWTK